MSVATAATPAKDSLQYKLLCLTELWLKHLDWPPVQPLHQPDHSLHQASSLYPLVHQHHPAASPSLFFKKEHKEMKNDHAVSV